MNKQLEFREEISLDNPDDIDWLVEWSKQAEKKIKELENELEIRRRIMKSYGNEIIRLDSLSFPSTSNGEREKLIDFINWYESLEPFTKGYYSNPSRRVDEYLKAKQS